jgi:hypothetical protein
LAGFYQRRLRTFKINIMAKRIKKSKGLGDTIEKITEATGIKSVVKSMFGDDCGCDERKKKLNEWFSYKVVNCLEENEYEYLKNWYTTKRLQVNADEQRELLLIFNRVFNRKNVFTSCGSCVRNMVRDLEKIYYEYK